MLHPVGRSCWALLEARVAVSVRHPRGGFRPVGRLQLPPREDGVCTGDWPGHGGPAQVCYGFTQFTLLFIADRNFAKTSQGKDRTGGHAPRPREVAGCVPGKCDKFLQGRRLDERPDDP